MWRKKVDLWLSSAGGNKEWESLLMGMGIWGTDENVLKFGDG